MPHSGGSAGRGGAHASTHAHGRANSLGLSDRQLEALAASLDGQGSGRADRRRRFVRWPFRRLTMDLKVVHPGGSAITFQVACRNLSRGGMSVLHSAYLYPGSACEAMLPRPRGGAAAVAGTIARCLHVRGMVHEVSIRFGAPIRAEEFVDRDPMQGQFDLENIEPEALVGTVLYVDDCVLDQRLVQHFLRGTNLRLKAALDAEQASAAASEGCDVAVCDFHPDRGDAAAAIEAVRAAQPEAPIIVVTADGSAGTMARVRQLGVSAFLSKPFNDLQLLQALGEFLLMRSPRPAGAGGGVDELGAALAEFPTRLEAGVRDEDAMSCYVLCQQVAGTARSMRMATLARLADEASGRLAATMSTAESERPLRDLIAACSRRGAA